ncbi:DoxX-like protein [Nocardia bhagyanarayanae]|uniref:DoxX-like protein n=1 Tax=Nocardia bhagyanarayanae TaxID=1215925 RepID=A0A543FHG3_9NOCA|nr:DoxX-like protein [Nocardia bhagyanarayanae]
MFVEGVLAARFAGSERSESSWGRGPYGGRGLILPAVPDIAPILVPVAATGTALLFSGAIIVRIRRGLWVTAVAEVLYLAMAVFVAWGRFSLEPFA